MIGSHQRLRGALIPAAIATLAVAGCTITPPPPSAPRTAMFGVCGVTQEDTPRCPGFAGDNGGSLHGSLTFSTLLFSGLRPCGLAVERTARTWAGNHDLRVIHSESGPRKLYLLAYSFAKSGWFEIKYTYDWKPPRAGVDVNFVDESLQTLEPATIPGFNDEFELDALLAKLTQDLRCSAD